MKLTDHARPVPDTVLARCADTDGAHGTPTNGGRTLLPARIFFPSWAPLLVPTKTTKPPRRRRAAA
ncbi:MAG: hypothetical protein ACRDT8_00045 [Micromonosporaceae bacterium]